MCPTVENNKKDSILAAGHVGLVVEIGWPGGVAWPDQVKADKADSPAKFGPVGSFGVTVHPGNFFLRDKVQHIRINKGLHNIPPG